MDYESFRVVESRIAPGVRFTVRKMSFARRMELMERVREIGQRMEFLAAGDTAREKMDAAMARGEIDRLYVRWGVQAIEGLYVDGEEATADALAQAGPEGLFREALALVRRETGLDEAERKNC